MLFSYKKVAVSVIVFTLVLTSALLLIAYRKPNPTETRYMLKEYKGTVALYKNGEMQTVYDGIVLTSLPNSDRKRFADGIEVKNEEEARIIIEDYDG